MTKGTSKHGRLEDFIALAQQGKKVGVEITLRKQSVKWQAPPGEAGDLFDGIMNAYLLIADWAFKYGRKIYKISKVYMFAPDNESPSEARANRKIANARLKMDYDRIKAARIPFESKAF